MKTIFLRALEAENKEVALRLAIREPDAARGNQRFEIETANFSAVPRSPFAYWVSDRIRNLFQELLPFEAEGRSAAVGLQSSDDFRFLRLWWEVGAALGFVGNTKGGQFSRYYSDVFLAVSWKDDGREIKSFAEVTPGSNHWSRNIRSADQYFRPGLTWSHRTTSGLSLRAMPGRCIFGSKGPAVLVEDDDSSKLLAILAIANSEAFRSCVELQLAAADAAARSYDVGVIQRTPFPALQHSTELMFASLARRAWSLKRSADSNDETSHAFYLPALLQQRGDTFAIRTAKVIETKRRIGAELTSIQIENDLKCFEIYNIKEADRFQITEEAEQRDDSQVDERSAFVDAEESDDALDFGNDGSESNLAAGLVSWSVGVAFGRFDVRLATQPRPSPKEPEPFDPLPLSSPGMLAGDDCLPPLTAPAEYPIAFPENGILADDPGHSGNLTAKVRAVFDEVFRLSAGAWWNEVGAVLDPKNHEVGTWLGSSFFEYHLKHYSKSRRKAPILWQLGVPSGRYSIWLYAHRLTPDSFFQIQNEFVIPKLNHEERQLSSLAQDAGPSPSPNERKEIAAQEDLVEELRALLDEVKLVAPLWKPMIDDGIVLTMAPLWRLVAQHKSWQKELKGKWKELAAGRYDWAHVAMHLWPERVIPKCAIDRSLAIAHGLEDIFWVLGTFGKWEPRPNPTRPIDGLVREWSSTAVKAALKGLVEVSAPKDRNTRSGRSLS